jgi:hypothetical protein
MLLLVISTRRRVAKVRRPQLKVVEGFDSFDIKFQSFTDTFFDEHIGFSREDCEKIYDELKFPNRLMFHRGSRNQFAIASPHCFLYFCIESSRLMHVSLETKSYGGMITRHCQRLPMKCSHGLMKTDLIFYRRLLTSFQCSTKRSELRGLVHHLQCLAAVVNMHISKPCTA